jgi:myo-inositol-1-phosphate synthase
MHATIGGNHIRDIEFSAAFDVVEGKVGLNLSEAIWAKPNNTIHFADVPRLGVPVHRGDDSCWVGKVLKNSRQ